MSTKIKLGKAVKQLNKPRNKVLHDILVSKISSGSSGKHKGDKDRTPPKKLTQKELSELDKE